MWITAIKLLNDRSIQYFRHIICNLKFNTDQKQYVEQLVESTPIYTSPNYAMQLIQTKMPSLQM